MSKYKEYDPDVNKRASMKYIKEKQKSILVRWKITDYTENIEPEIKKTNLPVTTFIKQAVDEKIERNRNMIILPDFIKKYIQDGENLVITGKVGTGKSTLMKACMSEAACSPYEYTFIDEVIRMSEIEMIKDRLLSNPYPYIKLIFTFYTDDIEEHFGKEASSKLTHVKCKIKDGQYCIEV